MNLIWESSMLLWLCNEEQQQNQLQQLKQFLSFTIGSNTRCNIGATSIHIKQSIITINSTIFTASNLFEFNRNDLDRLSNYLNNTTTAAAVATHHQLQQRQHKQQIQLKQWKL
jgi:hypothetical protein